jgi:serine/threonine protein kinase
MIGQRIGPYEIVRLLGEGGMGQVYEAHDGQHSRRAALKIMRPEFSTDRTMSARFLNEARAIVVVDHPGVVKIFDIGALGPGRRQERAGGRGRRRPAVVQGWM